MGVRLAIDKIASIVSAVVPVSQAPMRFRLAEDDRWGVTPDIVGRPTTGATRMFTVRLTEQPRDDGQSGTPGARLRARVEVLAVYLSREVQRTRLADMIAEDAASIQVALQAPTDWDGATTGILSIAPAENVDKTELAADNGDPIGWALGVVSTIIYREG